eukprot:257005-Pyramimonas_sp.AAC.1
MVPKKKYRWEAQSRVQSHAWDDRAGWLDAENPWDDGRGRALHALRWAHRCSVRCAVRPREYAGHF